MKVCRAGLYAGVLLFFSASNVFSECVEYKIVDHGDSVEAVCVGAPLSPEEQNLRAEEDKREQQRAANQLQIDRKRESDRIAEEQRNQERIAKEQKAQEQKAQELNRSSMKSPEKNSNRLEKARQQTIR